MALAAGVRLGPYEILAPVGAGGMGEVWRAHDSKLNRDVALKVLLDRFAVDPQRLARFKREARILAALNHPNIGAVYGLEEADDGRQALVLELVEGATLAERIARGPIRVDEALAIAKQIAEALETAHERGILHRDLKPSNIKLRPDGTVKVLDFGLAKAFDPDAGCSDADAPAVTASLQTESCALLGTAAYMSPEQARGDAVDKRADIWAFGCVVFELLTGEYAFRRETVSGTLAAVLAADPPWASLPSATPAAIRRLLHRCLERDTKRRLKDIGDARLEIEDALSAPRAEAAAVSGAVERRPHVAWIAAAALLVVSVAWGGIALGTRAPDASEVATQFSFDIATPSAAGLGHLTVSPDGKYLSVAVVSGTGSGSVIWLRALDRLDAQIVNGSEGATFPFWSPDSRFLAFFADGKLKRVDLSGAPPQTLCDASGRNGGTWNRDGVIVFGASQDGPLFRVAAAGGMPDQLTSLDAARQETAHRHPYFLPDGQHFLYTVVSADSEVSGIYVGSLDSNERKRVVSSGLKATFAAPNHLLFVQHEASLFQTSTVGFAGAGGTLMAQQFDPQQFETIGDPVPIAGVGGNFGNSAAGFAASESGGVLVYRVLDPDRVMQWYDRTGRPLGTVDLPAPWESPAVAPDLQRLAVVKRDRGAGDLWIFDQARGTTTRLISNAAFDDAPVWSPDGTRIVFSSNRSGLGDLYQTNSGGTGQDDILLKSDHQKIPEDWSADGRFILYRDLDSKTGWDLWAVPLTSDRKPQPLLTTPFDERQGQFSPDGRWIAYVSDETDTNQVYVQSFPPSDVKWLISTSGGNEPRWRRDGKALFFMSGGVTSRDVMSVEVDTSTDMFRAGVPQKRFTVRPFMPNSLIGAFNSWDVTPDGLRFLVVSPESTTAPPVTVVVNWLQRLNTR